MRRFQETSDFGEKSQWVPVRAGRWASSWHKTSKWPRFDCPDRCNAQICPDLPSGAKRSGRWTFKYSDDRPMAQTGQEWSLALRLAEHLQLFPDFPAIVPVVCRATSLPIAQSRKEVGWRTEAVSSQRQLLATWSTTVQPVDCSGNLPIPKVHDGPCVYGGWRTRSLPTCRECAKWRHWRWWWVQPTTVVNRNNRPNSWWCCTPPSLLTAVPLSYRGWMALKWPWPDRKPHTSHRSLCMGQHSISKVAWSSCHIWTKVTSQPACSLT